MKDNGAAARREALLEAAMEAEKWQGLKGLKLAAKIRALIDQPAPPAPEPDYRALCQELYGAARWLVDCKITVDGIDAVNDAWSKLRDALKAAEEMGVK